MNSGKRFEDFARMGSDWFWETDREGRFTFFSNTTPQLGFDMSRHLGRTRRDLARSDPENLVRLERIEARVRARQPFRGMVYHSDLGDAPPRWCEISGEPKYDTSGAFEGYRGVGRDVSALVGAQAALELKSRALTAILQATPDGVHVIEKSGVVLAVNDQLFELLGLPELAKVPASEAAAKVMVELAKRGEYGPGDPEVLARERGQEMIKAVTSLGSVTYQRRLTTGRWLEARLRGVSGGGMLSLYRDITESMAHQAELERQSKMMANIVANLSGGIAVFDAADRLLVWNDGFAELTGMKPAVVRAGMTARDLIVVQARAGEFGPCDPDAEADRRLAAFHEEQRSVTDRIRPNGQIVERRRNPMPEGGSVTIYIDVTERKRIEQELFELNTTLEKRIAERTAALGESERFQRTLMSNVPGIVYRTRKVAGRWVMEFASEGSRNLFGVTADDFVSGRIRPGDLIHPSERAAVRAKILADLQIGQSVELEYRARHADGTWRWVWDRANAIRSETGELVALEGLVLNIDGRKAAEQELSRARDALKDALDSLDQNMILYDRDDRLVMFTRHLPEQYPRAHNYFVAGHTFEEIFRSAVENDAMAIPPGLTKKQFIADRVAGHKRADGTIAVRHLPGGRVLHISERRSLSGGIIAVGRDVTEQLKIEQQLHEAQRMEALSQLTGGLAHDLNNYLAVIMGNLDLLAERRQADPEALKLIDGALAGARHGAELTRSLLAFSRRQPLDPTVLDVGERMGDIAPLLKRAIGENVALDLRVAPDLWRVKVDGAQFDSAIVHLANNAREAMPKGGTFTVDIRNGQPGSEEALAGDHVLIEITDTGVGMDAATLSRAFEPFFSTKAPGHGTGLGLSMVHGFVHQSGGRIRLTSRPGKGTTARLFLPRAPEIQPGAKVMAAGTAPRATENVVLVDDNDDVRLTVAEQLVSLGYRVAEASNGDAALALLDERASEFDLVFTDIVMPGKIDGLALARIIRERWPNLPVLLTTGFSSEDTDGFDGVRAEFNILRKPYRKAELARLLRSTLAK